MSFTLIVALLEAFASTVQQVAPLFAQGQTVLSENDASAVHAALAKAETSTAALRVQVDAALAKASAAT